MPDSARPLSSATDHERFLSDEPIDDDDDDKLGYAEYATALFSLIDLGIAETPCCIAVSGRWGSGKTSLAQLLERRLAGRPTITAPHLTCWFNAWLHASAEDVRAPLVATVARRANSGRPLHSRILRPLPSKLCVPWVRRLRSVLAAAALLAVILGVAWLLGGSNKEALGKLDEKGPELLIYPLAGLPLVALIANGVSPFIGGVSKYVADPGAAADAADMELAKGQLGRLIGSATRGTRKLVVFIDDLDRCDAEDALRICTLAVQLLAHRNVVIVVLGDMELLTEHASRQFAVSGMVGSEASRRLGKEYLEKIVQVCINLPEPSTTQLQMLSIRTSPSVDEKVPVIGWRTRLLNFIRRTKLISVIWLLVFFILPVPLFWFEEAFFYRYGDWFFLFQLVGLVGFVLAFFAVMIARSRASKQQAQMAASIDASITSAIEDGLRSASKIAELVQASNPEFVAYETPKVLQYIVPESWPIMESGDHPIASEGLDRKYIESRAHALLAQRWAAAVLAGDTKADSAWSAALTLANDTIADDLPRVPRRRKRILNNVFIHFMLADMRGVLDTDPTKEPSLDRETSELPRLSPVVVAKWALLVAEWPEVASAAMQWDPHDNFANAPKLTVLCGLDRGEDELTSDQQRAKRFLQRPPELDAPLAVLATMNLE